MTRCECGNERKRKLDHIKVSQRCFDCKYKRRTKYWYEPGQIVQNWTVLHKTKRAGNFYICRCKCGRESIIAACKLSNGKNKQCRSCSTRETARTHGLSRSKLYGTWAGMRQRCNNPNYQHYQYYGGKGVKVCERWGNFVNFLEDMAPKPEGDYTIDRIDSNGNYTKANCRWITRSENSKRMNQEYIHISKRKMHREYIHISQLCKYSCTCKNCVESNKI